MPRDEATDSFRVEPRHPRSDQNPERHATHHQKRDEQRSRKSTNEIIKFLNARRAQNGRETCFVVTDHDVCDKGRDHK